MLTCSQCGGVLEKVDEKDYYNPKTEEVAVTEIFWECVQCSRQYVSFDGVDEFIEIAPER